MHLACIRRSRTQQLTTASESPRGGLETVCRAREGVCSGELSTLTPIDVEQRLTGQCIPVLSANVNLPGACESTVREHLDARNTGFVLCQSSRWWQTAQQLSLVEWFLQTFPTSRLLREPGAVVTTRCNCAARTDQRTRVPADPANLAFRRRSPQTENRYTLKCALSVCPRAQALR
jgi:hypothetical protein